MSAIFPFLGGKTQFVFFALDENLRSSYPPPNYRKVRGENFPRKKNICYKLRFHQFSIKTLLSALKLPWGCLSWFPDFLSCRYFKDESKQLELEMVQEKKSTPLYSSKKLQNS